MRNLKKFLALVMAMVMAFSLMLTASAAASTNVQYSDSDQVTEAFAEAVDILSGMKVFQGDDTGTLRPGSPITRAETAALIYRLATGDTGTEKMDLYTTTHPFTDVKEGDWFAGYVGYCWNAGYIKGTTKTTFNPYANVTGYEVLAMVLRAMGYDANDEFTGNSWIVNVSSTAQQRGLLDDVKTTHYANTLHLASRRDVVASILFQAATKTRVVYTPAFGYQTGDHTTETNTDNYSAYSSLGWLNFNLTKAEGVIVGNQETGEKTTVLGVEGSRTYTSVNGAGTAAGPERTVSWSAYNYPGTSVVNGYYVWNAATASRADANDDADTEGDITVNNGQYYKWDTTIEQFGHKVEFWYKAQSSQNVADRGQTVYAMFDRVKKTDLVYAGGDSDAGNITNNTMQLHKAITDAGFAIATSGGNGVANMNKDFERFAEDDVYASTYASTIARNTNNKNNLYWVISNHTNADGKEVVDVIIRLNVQGSKIDALDNVSAVKYVGVVQDATTGDYLDDANNKKIAQAAIVGDSTKTLSDYELGFHIAGTRPNGGRNLTTPETGAPYSFAERAYFKLVKIASYKDGVVANYHNDANDIPGTGWVVLGDGTKLEQSLYYNTVQTNSIPQTDATGDGRTTQANDQVYGNMTYRFWLDEYGRYIGAEPIMGTEFVYGTYIDFASELGTSSYTYRMVGVDMDGKMVTKDIKKFNQATFADAMTSIVNISDATLALPYRGDLVNATPGDGTTGVQKGIYKGWAVNSEGSMTDVVGSSANLATTMLKSDTTSFPDSANIVINKTDLALGAVQVSTDYNGTASGSGNLFFTEKTKFILVSGTGTDTQKVAVYNGISELLGNGRTVTIKTASASSANVIGANISYLTDTAVTQDMMFYSVSDFIYAQDATQTSKQADVIFIPAEAVSGVGDTVYYVGDNSVVATNAYGENATKFTMYNGGEKGEYWVTDNATTYTGRNSTVVAANSDRFYTLTDTGLKATDGQPIYAVDAQTENYATATSRTDTGLIVEKAYTATTKDAQTAFIHNGSNNILYRVDGAKVVNLNAKNSPAYRGTNGYIWPGVSDLATLNEASSFTTSGAETTLKVSCVMSSDNLTAEIIYVCWDQN